MSLFKFKYLPSGSQLMPHLLSLNGIRQKGEVLMPLRQCCSLMRGARLITLTPVSLNMSIKAFSMLLEDYTSF